MTGEMGADEGNMSMAPLLYTVLPPLILPTSACSSILAATMLVSPGMLPIGLMLGCVVCVLGYVILEQAVQLI